MAVGLFGRKSVRVRVGLCGYPLGLQLVSRYRLGHEYACVDISHAFVCSSNSYVLRMYTTRIENRPFTYYDVMGVIVGTKWNIHLEACMFLCFCI